MFQNECIGELAYESTAAAIAMAAALITFLLDFMGSRLASRKTGTITMGSNDISPTSSNPGSPDREKTGAGFIPAGSHSHSHGHDCAHVDAAFAAEESWRVLLLEMGIIFHSYVPPLTIRTTADIQNHDRRDPRRLLRRGLDNPPHRYLLPPIL